MRRTVPPSAEIEARIEHMLSVGVGENPRESLSDLAKLGARLIIQRPVEDEFDAWLGRARYERRPDGQREKGSEEGRARSRRGRRRHHLDGSAALGERPRSHVGTLALALRPGGIREAQSGGRATSLVSASSSTGAPRTLSPSWWAGLPGCSRARRRPSGACARPASARFGACWKTGQPTPRTSARLSAPRSGRHTSHACPKKGGMRSSPPSWAACARRWTTCG